MRKDVGSYESLLKTALSVFLFLQTDMSFKKANETAIRIFGSQNVFQKSGPRPAAREGPPAIYRPNPNKPDELLPDAQRAPAVFQVGRAQRPSQLVRGTVR